MNIPSTPRTNQNTPSSKIKQSSFKLQLFTMNNHKKDERESIKRKLYKCPYCNKDYSSLLRYETGDKPFNCSYCLKKFNEKGNLKAHIRIHTGERPYQCTYEHCRMSFKTKGQLNNHSNRHSTLRPFKCTICHSSFNRKRTLKVHMMIHSGKKPYKCNFPDCEKEFREKANLTLHHKNHFKGKMNCDILNDENEDDNENFNDDDNEVAMIDIEKKENDNKEISSITNWNNDERSYDFKNECLEIMYDIQPDSNTLLNTIINNDFTLSSPIYHQIPYENDYIDHLQKENINYLL